MIKYGVKIPNKHLSEVETFCGNEKIDYLIWNAEEVFFTPGADAEILFNSTQDRNTAHEFLNRLERCEKRVC